jgi:hypothetical protein
VRRICVGDVVLFIKIDKVGKECVGFPNQENILLLSLIPLDIISSFISSSFDKNDMKRKALCPD